MSRHARSSVLRRIASPSSSGCGGHTSRSPKRGVVEGDLGGWKFRRFQGPLLDVEVWIEGNKAEAYTASYITEDAEKRGHIEDKDVVNVFVTALREARRRRCARPSSSSAGSPPEKGYQVDEEQDRRRARADDQRPGRGVGDVAVEEARGQGRRQRPRQRCPSAVVGELRRSLSVGAAGRRARGAAAGGPRGQAARRRPKEPYDANNPKPDHRQVRSEEGQDAESKRAPSRRPGDRGRSPDDKPRCRKHEAQEQVSRCCGMLRAGTARGEPRCSTASTRDGEDGDRRRGRGDPRRRARAAATRRSPSTRAGSTAASPPDGSYEVARARWDELAGQVDARGARRARARGAPDPRVPRAPGRARRRASRSTACGSSCGSRRSRASGLYVPGGTARYPSSVLMTAIPAKVAGVREVVMVTPGASPEALLAARLAGVDRVFELGGAQAIGALAYGTADRAAGRQDRRPGQRVGRLGQAPGLRRGRHRLDRGAVGGADHRRRERAIRRGSPPICSRRPSTIARRAPCSSRRRRRSRRRSTPSSSASSPICRAGDRRGTRSHTTAPP